MRDVVASTGGALLAGGTRALASVRPARKPLRPKGVVLRARIYRHGRPLTTLRLSSERTADQHISFDPVRHQVDGLHQYPSVVRLREPSYARARRSRR